MPHTPGAFVMLVAACSVACAESNTVHPVVKIDSGELRGESFGEGATGAMFLGIPFAAAPVGERRWRPPQPVRRWTGAHAASSYGAACPQAQRVPEELQREIAQTGDPSFTYREAEDCLYLNVWTPLLPQPREKTAPRLPVMFWIHGGETPVQLTPFARAMIPKGVVFVSTNFREGALGFMAHPALTAESPHRASGNYGLLDLIAALQWVHRNIAQFGGDPQRVTLFGESSGGMMVCFLMSSPLSQGLMHGAILQSLGCADTISPELHRPAYYEGGVGTAEGLGIRLMHALGISAGPDALRLLRKASPEAILAATERDPSIDFEIRSVIDGWALPEQPATLFARGGQMKIPVIVGSNSDEASNSIEGTLNGKPTLANYRAFLKREFVIDDDVEEIFRLYPASNDEEARTAVMVCDTDYEFGNSAHLMAKYTAAAGQRAWLYYFSYPARAKAYEGLGAFHGIEIKFLTGWFRTARWGEPNEADLRVSQLMIGYWTEFAKSGDPNAAGLPIWPAFDSNSDLALEIGPEARVRPTPHAERFPVFERNLARRVALIGRVAADSH